MTSERPSQITIPNPFQIRDLIRWTDIQDLAGNALKPNWDSTTVGIYITTESPFPSRDAKLPNGFRFPSSVMTDLQRAVYFAVISMYDGPDPATSPAFQALQSIALSKGERFNSDLVRRWLGKLSLEHGVSPEAAETLSLDDLLDCLRPTKHLTPPNHKVRTTEGTTPADPIPTGSTSDSAVEFTVADLRGLLSYQSRYVAWRQAVRRNQISVTFARMLPKPALLDPDLYLALTGEPPPPRLSESEAKKHPAVALIRNESQTRFGRPLDEDALDAMRADVCLQTGGSMDDVLAMNLSEFSRRLSGARRLGPSPPRTGASVGGMPTAVAAQTNPYGTGDVGTPAMTEVEPECREVKL